MAVYNTEFSLTKRAIDSVLQQDFQDFELIIIDEEDVYSKAQGEQILRDFFIKHPPIKTSIFHKINTNPNYRFGVIMLSTAKETFRVSITMKKFNTSFSITELRIEPAKD